jgi:hypothetical protein
VWLYSKEYFTEVNKNGNMKDGIGIEVMQLDSIVKEKTIKKSEVGRANPCSTKY